MSAFITNLESINNAGIQSARHNDTHSNDAYFLLITDIYTNTPNAIIVNSGVNYRVTTNDFQAWALYFNPDQISSYGVNNICEILAASGTPLPYIQSGDYQIITNPSTLIGDYFCVVPPDLGFGTPFADADAYYNFLSGYIPYGGWINITWQDGANFNTTFIVRGVDLASNTVILEVNSGDPIPIPGTTGRYGVTGTNN